MKYSVEFEWRDLFWVLPLVLLIAAGMPLLLLWLGWY